MAGISVRMDHRPKGASTGAPSDLGIAVRACLRWPYLVRIAVFGAALGSVAANGADPSPAPPSIDTPLAGRYFQEAKALSDRDGGKMWGAPLYGSTLFVDEVTREVVANQPDYKELLIRRGEVFVGKLPAEENVANTAVRWGGVTWTMVKWPLPEDAFERDKLILHESFHRIQDKLGLGGKDPSNDHLDTRDGRVWLQLEWRALGAALAGKKEARRRAIQDALIFRAFRRSLFPDAAVRERGLEMHEGIPEYTGMALCAKSRQEALAYAAATLAGGPSLKTFVRSFAYISGPAYGLLLDEVGAQWRMGLKPEDDLGDLLAKAIGFSLPGDLKAASEGRAAIYGGKELMGSEDARSAKKREELASCRARFVDGPVLFLPVADGFNYSFDPTELVPLEGVGIVYPFLRISSSWGVLEATRGALMLVAESVITGARVALPEDASVRPLRGEGWKLDLKPGWEIAPGKRPGDLRIKKTLVDLPGE